MLPPKGPDKIDPKALGVRGERGGWEDVDGVHVGVPRVLGRAVRPRDDNPLRGVGREQLEQSNLPARVQGEEPPRAPHLQDNVRAEAGQVAAEGEVRERGGRRAGDGARLVDRVHGQQEAGHGEDHQVPHEGGRAGLGWAGRQEVPRDPRAPQHRPAHRRFLRPPPRQAGRLPPQRHGGEGGRVRPPHPHGQLPPRGQLLRLHGVEERGGRARREDNAAVAGHGGRGERLLRGRGDGGGGAQAVPRVVGLRDELRQEAEAVAVRGQARRPPRRQAGGRGLEGQGAVPGDETVPQGQGVPRVLLQTHAQAQVVHHQVRQGLPQAGGQAGPARLPPPVRREAQNLHRRSPPPEETGRGENLQVLARPLHHSGQNAAAGRLHQAQGEEGEAGLRRGEGEGEGRVRRGGDSKDQFGRIAHSLQGLFLAQHPSPLRGVPFQEERPPGSVQASYPARRYRIEDEGVESQQTEKVEG